MIVTDQAGDEWGTYADVVDQLPGLRPATLRDWVRRGKVRTWQPYAGTRRGVMVCLTDALPLVRDAAGVGWRRGRRRSVQRGA